MPNRKPHDHIGLPSLRACALDPDSDGLLVQTDDGLLVAIPFPRIVIEDSGAGVLIDDTSAGILIDDTSAGVVGGQRRRAASASVGAGAELTAALAHPARFSGSAGQPVFSETEIANATTARELALRAFGLHVAARLGDRFGRDFEAEFNRFTTGGYMTRDGTYSGREIFMGSDEFVLANVEWIDCSQFAEDWSTALERGAAYVIGLTAAALVATYTCQEGCKVARWKGPAKKDTRTPLQQHVEHEGGYEATDTDGDGDPDWSDDDDDNDGIPDDEDLTPQGYWDLGSDGGHIFVDPEDAAVRGNLRRFLGRFTRAVRPTLR